MVRPVEDDPASEFAIRAKVVVNATGVWADGVRAMDEGTHPNAIRPAKGVHVTVPADRLPCDIAAVIPVPQDRRSIFVVSWPGTDLVYLGTTDTDYDGPLDDPACTPEDVDYLLGAANAVTTSELTRADVTGVWAGLRPLLRPAGPRRPCLRAHGRPFSAPHRDDVVARRGHRHGRQAHHLPQDGPGHRGRRRAPPRRVASAPALRDQVAPAARRHHQDPRPGLPRPSPTPASLGRYGTEAAHVLALAEDRPELLDPVVAGLPYTGAEFLYAVREEMARTLDDLLGRRTRADIQRAAAAMDAAPAVAALVADELGWDAATVADQIARFTATRHKELLTAGLELP